MSSSDLASLIDQKSSDKDIANKIASYLIDTKQTLQIDSLMRDVMSAREMRGKYELNVVSAHVLSQPQVNDIKSYIKTHFAGCKEVMIHQKVDPALLGGIRIESASYLVNRSLRGELNYIKSSINKQERTS